MNPMVYVCGGMHLVFHVHLVSSQLLLKYLMSTNGSGIIVAVLSESWTAFPFRMIKPFHIQALTLSPRR